MWAIREGREPHGALGLHLNDSFVVTMIGGTKRQRADELERLRSDRGTEVLTGVFTAGGLAALRAAVGKGTRASPVWGADARRRGHSKPPLVVA